MSTNSPSWQPQPTSRMCFVCGRQNPVGLHIHFYEDNKNQQVIAPLTIPEQYQGYPGVVHGGILAAILDETAGRAVMMGLEASAAGAETPFWVTAKLEMRYRQPTPTETSLKAVGWVVRKRSRSAEVAGEIRLPDGTVTAELSAVVVRPPAETLKAWEQEKKFWRVDDEV